MQWDTIAGWNLILTLLIMTGVLIFVRYTIYHDCTSLSRRLHTEVVAQVARETERTRNLEKWLERTERIVMELQPRVARLEGISMRGEEREIRGEEREIRAEERAKRHDLQCPPEPGREEPK